VAWLGKQEVVSMCARAGSATSGTLAETAGADGLEELTQENKEIDDM
jgi:hypothetical protein